MADHIPFVSSEDGAAIVRSIYQDSDIVRFTLDRASKPSASAKPKRIWLDPCVDGMDDFEARSSKPERHKTWLDFMGGCVHSEKIGNPTFHAAPVASNVKEFVTSVLNKCAAHKPEWITVPQLPLVDDSTRNKINRSLAAATGSWKSNSGFNGRLIFPLVVTHQGQIVGKTQRNPKVQQAEKCYHESQADGFWVVDRSLIDDNGSATLRNRRFPAVIGFHEELNDRVPSKIRIGGPYWGLNIVLWAKGLIDYPAIGIGSGYQYFLAGGRGNTPSVRLAIPSLRRRVSVSPQFRVWLDAAISRLGVSHPVHAELSEIRRNYSALSQTTNARTQVATFYKQWLNQIGAVPKAGRSMALFQDLSAAYALGKSLPELPDEGTARRPESVVEPLMLSCL